MLTPSPVCSLFQAVSDPLPADHLEIQRLVAAAAISKPFCRLLLDEPEQALQAGFQGESFLLTNEERALVVSIRARSLPEFALALARTCDSAPKERLPQPAGWSLEAIQ